ncbi:MAG: hypothetical protein FD165_1395 [Gammaproteobacteria bacterium]|nr:MAG: hypothetical protein FD165_1395 [Gammaproteobacteria bacterium]TND04016.1 MAG: hypothetical protein FD120_1725 [Gammaproteobacteria bacterium]
MRSLEGGVLYRTSGSLKSGSWLESLILSGCLLTSLFALSAPAFAAEPAEIDDVLEPRNREWKDVRLDGSLRVRGVEFGDRAYIGQTKVGGKWGLGIVVDRGHYAYGAANHGVLFLKRF